MLERQMARLISAALIVATFVAGCSTAPPEAPTTLRETSDELRSDLREARNRLAPPRPVSSRITPALPTPEHPSVAAAIRYFSTDRKPTIQGSLDRSVKYRAMIDEVIAEYGLPPEIAFLPVIESGYRTGLTSSAGAHGMWQFMAPTAREYDLRVDWWVDERADPLLSTHAAATYLKALYRMFDDWPLALAAYNAGPGRVSRTLKRTGATTFWELLDQKALPKETRGYVPTFFATAAIVGDPERYGFRLPPALPYRDDLGQVMVRGPVSLEFVALESGTHPEILRAANLALHRGLVPPGKWPLRAPHHVITTIGRKSDLWPQLDVDRPVSLARIAGTDSLTTLAARLSVDPDELRRMNGLDSDRIASGSTLWVPLPRGVLRERIGS